jgi:hypothetical protein
MGICNAKHLVLKPIFNDGDLRDCQFISRANVQIVQFELPDNCPHLEQLRKEGKVEWAMSSIDFRGRRKFYNL